MSATQTPAENDQSDTLPCTRCEAVLPQYATFCGQCGQRVKKPDSETSSPDNSDVTERYRITSLVRRRLYTQLFLAFDNQQAQAVAIHTVNLHRLKDEERASAIEAFQAHYDLLRRHSLPTLMRPIDLRYFQEHLYLIANWPKQDSKSQGQTPHLSTLFSLLQSGIGLPDPQIAIAWIYRLSRTLEILHKNSIVLGDIDPDTLLTNAATFEGDLALMVSWLPKSLFPSLSHSSIDTNTAYFSAPETVIEESDPRSDIYSLGAILYLLLSGAPPKDAGERARQPLTGLREVNPRINGAIDAVVMHALALNREERYQSAHDFSEALLQLSTNSHDLRHSQKIPSNPSGAIDVQSDKEEIHISSPVVDNTSDKATDGQTLEGEEATISIVPLQARMARRYLSRRKTNKAETSGKQSGEASVEEGLLEEEAERRDALADSKTETLANPSVQEEHPSSENDVEARLKEKTAEVLEANAEEMQAENSIKSHNGTQQIQEQSTLPLHQLSKETGVEPEKVAPAENGTNAIEELDTMPFSYPVLEPSEQREQREEQEKKDGQEKPDSRALQVQGTMSLQTQVSGIRESVSERLRAILAKTATLLPELVRVKEVNALNRAVSKQLMAPKDGTILKHVQHFLLGEPQNSTKAAALIETPLRIQPGQNYSIRINVIGRDKPTEVQLAGLSALANGEKVHIEVRSALYQNYAYIVQQADIEIPGEGFVAEIVMPMQSLGGGQSGRRERLHIFFMDDANNPLYEKPFVIELFISHLVQSGREGHNVLSIPL
jgi:serine/threonine protein kinase/ribosomal protein L40E